MTMHGELAGTGVGTMLSAGDPAAGEAGYVALETFEGTLAGRLGSFALQQLGVMHAGGQDLHYAVVPGSGTDELTGMAGTLHLEIADGEHRYRLTYSLS